MPLSDVPGLSGYLEQKRLNEQEEEGGRRRLADLLKIAETVRARQDEAGTRSALAETQGDLAKAVPVLVQRGNINGAKGLAALLEVQRKENAPRVMAPGSQLLGPNNELLHTTPFAPQRPQAMPEIINLQTMLDALPEGSPHRAQIQSRIAHLSGGDRTERSPFGTGSTGGAMDILTRLAPGYAAGTTTPDEDRYFQMAVAHYTQPKQFQNPDTGLLETRRPELPTFVTEAVGRRRGARAAAPSPSPAPAPAPSVDPQPAPRPGAGQGPADAGSSKTVWSLAQLVTGPVPAGAELLSRTPLVGDMVQAPQFTQARNYVPQLQRDLVRALQNSPRFPEGERKAIEREISIEPRLFDNSTAFRDRLIGIDDALFVRERNAFDTSNSPRVGRDERIQAMNVLNAIQKFRHSLGVPPRVRDDSDWEALPAGTEYIAPDGRVKRKQ